MLRRFHRPRFHGIRHLAETGELPAANFDACPATKKEWAFAPDGGLYGCTATVGNPAYRLGSFCAGGRARRGGHRPLARAQRPHHREVPGAARLAPVCGGGCGALGAIAPAGRRAAAPDCRPVQELYGLGARFYGLGE